MSEISLNHQKKALLYEHYATLQNATEIADPFIHSVSKVRKPLDPKLNKILLALLAVAAAHTVIWYVSKYFPVSEQKVIQPKPVVVEIVKPIEPPKPIEPKIPPVTQKPKVPPIAKKTEPVEKPLETSKPKLVQKTQEAPRPVEKEPVIPQKTVAEPVVKQEVKPEPVASKPVEENLPMTEARGYAGYLSNPAPEYPEQALERGWEGSVILRVKVLPNGSPASVDVKQSSGKKVLDSAAVRTVKQWKFSPAKKGNTAVEGWVDVPIHYQLPK
nr:energy transducer TonB [Acinetobacter sp. Marseille-Q1620]